MWHIWLSADLGAVRGRGAFVRQCLCDSVQYFTVDRRLCDGQREGPPRRGAAQHPDNAGALVRSAGLILYLCRVNVPELIRQPLQLVGNMNTPLSMIITGMLIAGSKPEKLLGNREIYRIILIRMLFIRW